MAATIEKEKDIEGLVENTIDKLKVVKHYSEKENRQIVIELAKDLEAIIPMDTICTEIINRLHGHLKPRTIREYLDVKYKIKTRVQNARKQKKNKQSGLAAKPPLNKPSETVVIDGKDKISFQDVDNPQSFQPKEISVVDNIDITSLSQKESLNLTEQKQSSEGQVNTEIAECPGCIGKEERIKELEEALQKVTQFIAADKIGPSAASKGLKEAPEEPLEFEVSKMGSEIRDFFISNNIKSTKDTIWFSGKIDRTTGKIINFDLGRKVHNHRLMTQHRLLEGKDDLN